VIAELLAWRAELQTRYRNPLFRVSVPTLNLGHIHGGDNPNRICGHCELHFDIRPLPGMDLDDLRAQIERRVGRLLDGSGLRFERQPLFSGIPAMETPDTADIVRAAEHLTGHAAEAVAFGTEAPYLRQIGLQTIVLGPGDIDQAHQPDEYLALDRVKPARAIVRQLVERFCL
jgi:acetylornithine deacetylase